MPKAVHDLAIKLQGKGKSEDSAWAIANSQLGKTTKNDKNLGEMMQDQSPSMTNVKPSPQNTGTWPTSMNPNFGNTMGQMREDDMPGMPSMPGMPCDICGGPEHPPMDHPFLPRMPNDPMAMTQQPQMPMAPLPMQAPPPMPQMQQPPMQPHPAQTQQPPNQEGGLGSGRLPSGGGGPQQAPSGGGQSGGGDGGSGGGGEGGGQSGFGGQRAQPGPIMSFETVKMNETIMKQLIDRKVGCGCQKTKKG